MVQKTIRFQNYCSKYLLLKNHRLFDKTFNYTNCIIFKQYQSKDLLLVYSYLIKYRYNLTKNR